MSEKRRLGLFLFGAVGVAAMYVAGARNLPPWGAYRGPYGDVISRLAVYERHATDVVNAITYDYRGFDTLGEEFILFSAVIGVMLLLRPENDQPPEQKSSALKDRATLSETVKVFATVMCGITVLFGIYIVTHGQLTPGGGFQGGVIIAAAPMLIYIAQDTEAFRRIVSHPLLEFAEATGAACYAVVGLVSLVIGAAFLTNILPLGQTGDVFSSGSIAVISALVGLEVAAAFLLITSEYLREILSADKDSED
jgi:multicomponent Na+:H+ antiporter subunit B